MGYLQEGDILDLAVNLGLVNKSGAWFSYNGDKIGQGRENAKIYLTEHAEVMETLDAKIREHYNFDGQASEKEAEPQKPEKPAKKAKKDEKAQDDKTDGKAEE